ncbi:hypothetical protein BV20DRAFT_975709 [Pilatotrama ljubarskyi]|nr:hypothetical protein BV20DRAFT_975709 [Pilatotrama ljubarskyi]
MERMDVAPSASEKIPAEIWLDILDQVPSTADLHSMSVTCKKFHDLSLRALHRDLIWTKPEHVARSLPLWDAHQGMDVAVRSLELGVSTVPPGTLVSMIGLDGNPEAPPPNAPRLPENGAYLRGTMAYYHLHDESRGGFASRALHDAMIRRINTFTNISSLTFTNMLVYDMHFALIHSLPQLRSLRLELCIFQDQFGSQTFNHATLPITELTLLNVRRRVVSFFLEQVSFDENLSHVLSLCTAHNLRTLTVDPTADVFWHIYGAWNAAARGWTIPSSLAHVFVVRRRLFEGEVQPVYFGENNFPETHLYHFAVQAPALRTLSTPIFVPPNVTIAAEALARGLKGFAAPVETALVIARVREVEALGLLNCGLESREGINAVESVAMSRPGLKMLMLELKGWDDEIVPAVTGLLKELRRLKIVYKGNARPSEDFMVMLAPELLRKLRELHTLELYAEAGRIGRKAEYPRALYDASFETIEEELVNLVIPWNRYCPKLRRVQLCAGYVVKRACEGGRWTVERIRCLEEKDDLRF